MIYYFCHCHCCQRKVPYFLVIIHVSDGFYSFLLYILFAIMLLRACFSFWRHLAGSPLRTCGSVRTRAFNPLPPVVTAVTVPTNLIPSAADEGGLGGHGQHLSVQFSQVYRSTSRYISDINTLSLCSVTLNLTYAF